MSTLTATNGTLACIDAFVACSEARQNGILIKRVSKTDKEYHFQDWVAARFDDAGITYDPPRRNTYPDFTLVNHPEGYEVKGLQWPGREASFDSNSRVPSGLHYGRTMYYIFGRYPVNKGDLEYPVVDLILCHGNFLNADHAYVHKNKSFRGFGSYGDLQVRDRKMYVAPSPFALTNGTMAQATLIVPSDLPVDSRLEKVGELVRTETGQITIGYSFDLRQNELTPELAPNPSAGAQHRFAAYRLKGVGNGTVTMKDVKQIEEQLALGDDE